MRLYYHLLMLSRAVVSMPQRFRQVG
jgi:hypothetical protein